LINLWEGFLGTGLRKIVEDEDLEFINLGFWDAKIILDFLGLIL
jgi:hypothetical protein